MPKTNDNLLKQLIERVISHAKQKYGEQDTDLFAKFIKIFYSQVSYFNLEQRSIADLLGLVWMNWQLIQHRQPDAIKVEALNPSKNINDWQSNCTVIAVLCQDAPFLVDSIKLEINKLGLSPNVVICMGGMVVKRSENGDLVDLNYNRSASLADPIESPIYLEIEKQEDSVHLDYIVTRLKEVIADVLNTVKDWRPMVARMQQTVQDLEASVAPLKPSDVKESIAFLNWLMDDHFIFLGARDYGVTEAEGELCLKLVSGTGLGVLTDESESLVVRKFSDLPLKTAKLMLSIDRVLMISKTNTQSSVHRGGYTDYIGVKLFNDTGELIGERRFIGLYTSKAYHSSPNDTPFLRKKVTSVIKKSGFRQHSHAEKDLIGILSDLPRDDLIQATIGQLYNLSMGILHMQERRCTKLFVREDNYGRFVSCLVYLPREKFTTELLQKVQNILMTELSGLESTFSTHFSVSILARIDFVIRVNPKVSLKYNIKAIEAQLTEASRSWKDYLQTYLYEQFEDTEARYLTKKYIESFPASYRETTPAEKTVIDIQHLEELSVDKLLTVECDDSNLRNKQELIFKVYNIQKTVALSDAVPIFEHLGCHVVDEYPYSIVLSDGSCAWINEFHMTCPNKLTDIPKDFIKEAFLRVWDGDAEDDNFNQLVLLAKLNWRHVSLLRAYAKYFRQVGTSFSANYMATTLIANPNITQKMVELFESKFNPENNNSSGDIQQLEARLYRSLDAVTVLDEDRIFRKLTSIIMATLRTNFYQRDSAGNHKPYISLKINSSGVLNMPLPLPKFDIFVYSPDFEGIHLRADNVARGGIRWSDRRQDFRVEVLGLMKAQQVKNSVIVPAGAKGGFVVKKPFLHLSREDGLQLGIDCYQGFISGLLDVVDNIVDNQVIKPDNTICYDGDDYYLVVAADKGTAKFSDIANKIAIERNFWLGDAFASGGETGYDHMKMGITARGAWVSAERHFLDLGINIKKTEFTVVGIGDMSGDVFGNGLLMSNKALLTCAFNHQHIFIDPEPDAKKSYKERQRLFSLPRSTWADYNQSLISRGGEVFERSQKSIKLSGQIQKLLGVRAKEMVPADLIKAILCSKVDMIWNGGIGTFIKATTETDLLVGDFSNDGIRVNANQVEARMICEGGNLGLTQLARIEYEQHGGRINTDFIDNSAGVDCSDHEVNIKILLNDVIADGGLSVKARNKLLSQMDDEVAQLVLRNNYLQNQTISFASHFGTLNMPTFIGYIASLTASGDLDPKIEYLPSAKELQARKDAGKYLTRPELSVLLAYSKIVLANALMSYDFNTERPLIDFVKLAFPETLRKTYSSYIENHRMKKQIIVTQLSHYLVSDMGITFAYQMQSELGVSPLGVVKAYVAALEIFDVRALKTAVEALDGEIPSADQHNIGAEVFRLLRHAVRWLLRNKSSSLDVDSLIKQYKEPVSMLASTLPRLLVGEHKLSFEKYCNQFKDFGLSDKAATSLATPVYLYHSLNIVEAAGDASKKTNETAKVYFQLIEYFHLTKFRKTILEFPADDDWSLLAKSGLNSDLDKVLQLLTSIVMRSISKETTVDMAVEQWGFVNKADIESWMSLLNDFNKIEKKDFSSISVVLRQLMKLASIEYIKVSTDRNLLKHHVGYFVNS